METKLIVLHVHYLGTWAELDQTRVAQVNARWPNTANYQYEPHARIQCGIMPTQWMFIATAVKTNPKKKNDPTEWMGGGPNQPPPWRWREDPTRELDSARATIVIPSKPGVAQNLKTYYEEEGVLLRFQQAHAAMAHAHSISLPALVFSFPTDVVVGEGKALQPLAGADVGDASASPARPFASAKHWAAFTVTGDGRRVEHVDRE